jgi:hypothetical protein
MRCAAYGSLAYGTAVIFDRKPPVSAGEVIVTFLDSSALFKAVDDGSLAYLFRDYTDDGDRALPVDFDEAAGNERWQTVFPVRANFTI